MKTKMVGLKMERKRRFFRVVARRGRVTGTTVIASRAKQPVRGFRRIARRRKARIVKVQEIRKTRAEELVLEQFRRGQIPIRRGKLSSFVIRRKVMKR